MDLYKKVNNKELIKEKQKQKKNNKLNIKIIDGYNERDDYLERLINRYSNYPT